MTNKNLKLYFQSDCDMCCVHSELGQNERVQKKDAVWERLREICGE